MIQMDQQLHGYRHGHQLLSASVKLPKPDQDLVDRLSDIAGPLRPGERFEPYITGYPLPSASHYVLARTWQDHDAPRAGCVRTRSLLIPMEEWMAGVDIVGLVDLISRRGPFTPADHIHVNRDPSCFPRVPISQGVELVEALFLEERKPIVVFDASDPEGITVRLLAAFWPSFRRTFAVSTFALSPRTIGNRNFDLIFAPKDARSRFSDWAGRRIDASKPPGVRHRWSHELVNRVFADDTPSLLRDDILGGFSSESGGTEADLRISLLWNELHDKVETSPNAVLGLLDIANSRSTRNIDAIKRLEPELGRAALRAAATLSPSEAWRFLLALTDKLSDVRLRLSVAKTIRGAAAQLASRAPMDAIANVEMLATARGYKLLLSAVGDGIAQDFDSELASAFVKLDSDKFLQLLLLSPALAETALTRHPDFSARLATALTEVPAKTRVEAKRRLLRLLTNDQHAEAARLLIAHLNHDELLSEAKLLGITNGFAAEGLYEPLVNRAREIGAVADMRDIVAAFPENRGTNELLHRLLAPNQDDFRWLLETPILTYERRLDILRHLLRSATDNQFRSTVVGSQRDAALGFLMKDPAGSLDIVARILEDNELDPSIAVNVVMRLLPHANDDQARQLASRALEIVLSQNIGTERDAVLDKLLGIIGSRLNGSWAIHAALKHGVPSDVVAANLAAFNRSSPVIRRCIMLAIEDLASMIVARGWIDYPEHAVVDAASLLWDSAILNRDAFLRSSATLMPFLLRRQYDPASPLIAAAFPPVYQELKKANSTPDIFRFFLFTDWDRCKTARHQLVDAFMRSNWRATDIALAAARAGDLGRILRRIARQGDGSRIIADIKRNLSSIPSPWCNQVSAALEDLHTYGWQHED